jgi:hypothetical protein
MAAAFDPYHRWLGIPPADQPPNHYRLLAINLFEDDAEVIEHAADRQMAHLRSFSPLICVICEICGSYISDGRSIHRFRRLRRWGSRYGNRLFRVTPMPVILENRKHARNRSAAIA